MQFDDFLSVLDLLQNPDKYATKIAELTQREGQLKDARDMIDSRIAVAVTKEQADTLLTEAGNVLEDAKAKAQKMLDTQQTAFDKRLADLLTRETAADQAMTTFRNSKLTWAARAEEHRAKEEQLFNGLKQLDADRADLASKQAEVEVRLNKLRQAMG